MKKKVFKFIFQKVLGWDAVFEVEIPNKCVITVAPHTSNWDLIIGKIFYAAYDSGASFMMKKEWFFFPLGYIFKAFGGVPVHRDKNTSLVDQMSAKFKERDKFHLAITPEGTRKPNPKWKKGFFYIAQAANVPIVVIGINYKKKTVVVGKIIEPKDKTIEEVMPLVKDFYKDFNGKIPANFDIGKY